MTIYLHASTPKSQWRDNSAEDAFRTLTWHLDSTYGRSDPALLANRLDLTLCGAAFKDITGWQSIPYGSTIRRRDFIDLWAQIQTEKFTPARGYEEWVWGSAFCFLRVLGTEGRGARLLV